MCPQCYLTALLLAVFGSYASFIVENPYVIGFGIGLFALAGFWLWKGFRRGTGRGRLIKNMGATIVVLCIFMLGYLTASWQTHKYFEAKSETDSSVLSNGMICQSCSN